MRKTIMYGFMKTRACALSTDERRRRRLHYCGACKTLGRRYGARARFLLNHDATFLAEVLSALDGTDARLDEWQAAYHSYNCLRLPDDLDATPRALRYAAAATLLMTELKIADQRADSDRLKWRFAQRAFDWGFSEAARDLAAAGVPVDDVHGWLAVQNERERAAHPPPEMTTDDVLTHFAEPTAVATGVIFGCGAQFVGGAAHAEMERVGRTFGEAIYLLDALEDFQKDARAGEFNALRAAFGVAGERLPDEARRSVVRRLRRLRGDFAAAVHALPILELRKATFIQRFDENLARRIGNPLPALNCAGAAKTVRRLSLGERWRTAVRVGETLSARFRGVASPTAFPAVSAFLIFAGCMATAFLFPHQAQEAQTHRECLELNLNVMAAGGLVGSVVASVASGRKDEGEKRRADGCDMCGMWCDPCADFCFTWEEHRRIRRGERSWCDGGCCDLCDCCGVCEGCEGCNCCESCNCCNGCGCDG
jgi:hypothetical protein